MSSNKPFPSSDLDVFKDNSLILDNFVNSQDNEHPDRFGRKRPTITGIIKEAFNVRTDISNMNETLIGQSRWDAVPKNTSLSLGGDNGALNKQAQALFNRTEMLKAHGRDVIRRTYLAAGYNLVEGSFEQGGVLVNSDDVLLQEKTGKCYSGPIGQVAKGTDPLSGSFVDKSYELPMASKVTFISEAIGAVPRFVADRLNDAVNAKDYGATGLGVVDETEALLKAVKAVKFAGTLGGTVYIPAGKYRCNLEVFGADNVSIIGDRNGTILQSFTQDGWALTYTGSWIPSPFQAALVSGITFVGVNKRGNGLQNNIGSGLELGYNTFNNCGIGYLSNATISYGIDNCFFYQCYIGSWFTCRTSAGSGTLITYGPSNVAVVIKSAFFAQQPGDVTFNRTTFTACDCSVFIEQPDNPYSHDGGFRFYGGVMQSGVSGIIMRDIGGQLSVPNSVDSPWFEGMKPASTVVINGVAYNGCDVQIHTGVVSVKNTVLSHLRVKDGATMYLDNVVVPSGVTTFDIDAGASVIGGNLRSDTVSLPFLCKSIRSTRTDGTSGRAAAAIVGPHSTKSYRGAGDGTKLVSQSLSAPYLLTKWGAGATVTNVTDGVLDTQSCNEITDVAGGGVYLNYTTSSTGFIVMVVSMRSPANSLDIRVTPDGAGAINGLIDFKLTPKWQTFAISGRGRGAGLSARFIFGPKTGSGTWRMSAIQVLEFPDEMSLNSFLAGSEFML